MMRVRSCAVCMRVRAICEGCGVLPNGEARDGALGDASEDCRERANVALNHGLRLDPTLASLARLAE